jgi:hypothetical protein
MVGMAGTGLPGMRLEQQLVELAGDPAPGFAKLEDLANHRGRSGEGTLLGPGGSDRRDCRAGAGR